jgi:hypothetical protein
MARDDRDELDALLQALPVHDVSPASVQRTRARCIRAMSARAASTRPALSGPWWAVPVAAAGGCLVYLAAAVQAATVLLLLR